MKSNQRTVTSLPAEVARQAGNQPYKKPVQFLFFLFAVFCLLFSSQKVSAATLYISPGSGNFGVGSTINVSVLTNTQGAAVNTAEAHIGFSANTLELVSVRQGSTFYLVSPGSPTRGPGTAYFAGGVPTPGYTGTAGTLGVMTFRATAVGTGTVSIDSGHVLLNDGLGTDALTARSGASFNIAAAAAPPVGRVTVSSSSHPNPDAWYQKSDVDLSWNRPNGAFGFSFELDQNPNTVPDGTLDTTVTTTQSYKGLKDGVWYFHIKDRAQSASAGFGATTHFRIQIDTESPRLFDIKLEGETDLNDVSRTPTINFKAEDISSGIDYYSVDVDGVNVVDKTGSPYTFSTLSNGPHVIRVTAFDKAGNIRRSQLPIIVTGPAVVGFFQRNLSLPLYLIFLMNFLVLILLIVLIWLVLKKKQHRTGNDEIAKLELQLKNLNREAVKTKAKLEQQLKRNQKAR